jgi:hypothetical protein
MTDFKLTCKETGENIDKRECQFYKEEQMERLVREGNISILQNIHYVRNDQSLVDRPDNL